MHDALLTVSVAHAERTVGTLSSAAANDGIHALFFQARGQVAGFLPDSSPAAHDYQNVRDGRESARWNAMHAMRRAGRLPPGDAGLQLRILRAPLKLPSRHDGAIA